MAKASIKRPAAAKAGNKATGASAKPSAKGSAKIVLKKTTKPKAAPAPVAKAAPAKAPAPKAPAAKAAPVKTQVAAARPSPARTNGKSVDVVKAGSRADRPAIAMKPEKSSRREREREAERRPVNVAAPVPTDMKPAKNQAGLRVAELEHYRDLLLAKRRELVGDMSSMEREALQRGGSSNLSNLPMHMADMGTDNYEQEFTLGLMEKDRNLLREINSALAKIQDGTYGLCEGTGKAIGKPRLEAQPWARFGIEHARKMEQRGVR